MNLIGKISHPMVIIVLTIIKQVLTKTPLYMYIICGFFFLLIKTTDYDLYKWITKMEGDESYF